MTRLTEETVRRIGEWREGEGGGEMREGGEHVILTKECMQLFHSPGSHSHRTAWHSVKSGLYN